MRKSSAYHRIFELHLIDNGVYPDEHDYLDNRETPVPNNLAEITQRLVQYSFREEPTIWKPSAVD
jgi:hypothetical protein